MPSCSKANSTYMGPVWSLDDVVPRFRGSLIGISAPQTHFKKMKNELNCNFRLTAYNATKYNKDSAGALANKNMSGGIWYF